MDFATRSTLFGAGLCDVDVVVCLKMLHVGSKSGQNFVSGILSIFVTA